MKYIKVKRNHVKCLADSRLLGYTYAYIFSLHAVQNPYPNRE